MPTAIPKSVRATMSPATLAAKETDLGIISQTQASLRFERISLLACTSVWAEDWWRSAPVSPTGTFWGTHKVRCDHPSCGRYVPAEYLSGGLCADCRMKVPPERKARQSKPTRRAVYVSETETYDMEEPEPAYMDDVTAMEMVCDMQHLRPGEEPRIENVNLMLPESDAALNKMIRNYKAGKRWKPAEKCVRKEKRRAA